MEEFRRRHLEMLNRRSAEAAIRSSEEESTSRKVAET
jgi:hypothetical protein